MAARTLFHVLEETASRYGDAAALHQPVTGKGPVRYRSYTWNEFRDAAREIACGLRSCGIGRGDVVALHSETRAEFYLADMGAIGNGCIAAALYTSLPPGDHVRTVAAARPKALFVENRKVLEGLRNAGVELEDVLKVVLDGEASEDCIGLDALRERGSEALRKDPGSFQRHLDELTREDYAVLYLTSGATGEPKMGLVTQGALVDNIELGGIVKLGPEDSALAFLPSAHIAQRLAVEFLPIGYGTPVWFSEGLSKMPIELKQVRPTFLLAPPRVWERVYANVSNEVKKKPAPVRNLFYAALGLGLRAADLRNQGKPVPLWMKRALALADKLVFRTVRERLGGRLRLPVSGAAPLGRDLARFFQAIGMPLFEGYGLTEGGITMLNPLDNVRAGSIGKPFPGVEIRIAEDGELLIKSPTLFSGYLNDPEATAAVLRDGWLYTGDIAEMDADGYLYITGRKKELIVSSNGKKIYPARIESLFKVEPLVNQILLVGDRQPYVTALITINSSAAETLPGMETLKGASPEQVATAQPVHKAVDDAVKRINRQLGQFEQIRRFHILERDFSIERGELTPTMKVRRKQVLDNYKQVVSELYLGREEMV
ncbi:MAG TPA: long-chain fatty acid--CoA ligase [Bryobacteraceae bacterium]|nr:long-chain fatty acid--CoA ligase [Bryobacteraceae bacterium]